MRNAIKNFTTENLVKIQYQLAPSDFQKVRNENNFYDLFIFMNFIGINLHNWN